MKRVILKFQNHAERRVFIHAIWWAINFHHSRHNSDMCQPYNEILASAYSNKSCVCLFGGFLECAKFALSRSDFRQDICQELLERINEEVV